MRNIRTKRVRTEATNFFAQPFQESVLELQFEKHYKCLLQIQKNHFDKAALILQEIINDESLIAIAHKDRIVLRSLTFSVKAFLLQRQGRYEEALLCVEEGREGRGKYENGVRMRLVLGILVKGVVLSKLERLQDAKTEIQQAFQIIKLEKEGCFSLGMCKNVETYQQIFIIFFDMIILQLSKLLKFQEISSIYRQGYQLSDKILGKDHKLTKTMRRIVVESMKDRSLSKKSDSFKESSIPVRTLYSKRKLKVNEQKMQILSTKQRQMKRIYHDNDGLLGKLTVSNKLTKKDENYYLRSLEKVKSIYNSRNKDREETQSGMERSKDTMMLQDFGDSNDASRRRIKDIILKGRRLNRNMIYFKDSDYTRTEPNFENTTVEHQENMSNIEGSHLDPEPEPQPQAKPREVRTQQVAELPKELTFKELARKAEAVQESKQECQLI